MAHTEALRMMIQLRAIMVFTRSCTVLEEFLSNSGSLSLSPRLLIVSKLTPQDRGERAVGGSFTRNLSLFLKCKAQQIIWMPAKKNNWNVEHNKCVISVCGGGTCIEWKPPKVFGRGDMLGVRTYKQSHFPFQTILKYNNKVSVYLSIMGSYYSWSIHINDGLLMTWVLLWCPTLIDQEKLLYFPPGGWGGYSLNVIH